VSCKVEHTKAHLTKLKRDTKLKVLQSELNIKIMEITEEQIKEAHNAACSQWKQKIEQWFPECFKQNLEAGKWYKAFSGKSFKLFFAERLNEKGLPLGYGFCDQKKWLEDNNEAWLIYNDSRITIEATESEVFEALKNEAVKRGFVEGAWFKGCEGALKDEVLQIEEIKFASISNGFASSNTGLYNSDSWIFHGGQWAEIIPIKTRSEAEKELNCKIVD